MTTTQKPSKNTKKSTNAYKPIGELQAEAIAMGYSNLPPGYTDEDILGDIQKGDCECGSCENHE